MSKPKDAGARPKLVAQLDPNGVLTGFKAVKKPKPSDVVVPHNCDLEPGRYRWHAEGGRFEPLPPAGGEDALAADPNALRAIALGFAALADQKIVLPAATTDWARGYLASFDAGGAK